MPIRRPLAYPCFLGAKENHLLRSATMLNVINANVINQRSLIHRLSNRPRKVFTNIDDSRQLSRRFRRWQWHVNAFGHGRHVLRRHKLSIRSGTNTDYAQYFACRGSVARHQVI